jgi:hypothetical protein
VSDGTRADLPIGITTTGSQPETKDQTIARLEAELAASREMGPCGKHPKLFWTSALAQNERQFRGDNVEEFPGECTICAELAATRAECYERVVIHLGSALRQCQQENMNLPQFGAGLQQAITIVKHITTPSDAAARDERDRRIRLEEAEWWQKFAGLGMCERKCTGKTLKECPYCTRLESLRAPVPAERAGDAAQGFCALCSSCGGCTKGHVHCRKCECHGTGRAN